VRPDPILIAAFDRRDGGEMKNAVDIGERVPNRDRISDVADHQLAASGQVLATARRKIVEHTDLMMLLDQGFAQIRADESTTTRDQISRHDKTLYSGAGQSC
jgi:hypothetical protein